MLVAVERTISGYPSAPFHPSNPFPEYPYPEQYISNTPNPVYTAVREVLRCLKLDQKNFGTPCWNPLGELLQNGQKIVIKPNWVNHFNLHSDDCEYFQALVTQGSVIRTLLDYASIALRGGGKLTIVDLPIQSANFERLRQRTGLDEVMDFVLGHGSENLKLDLLDLRDSFIRTNSSGALLQKIALPGDPLGYAAVDLGNASSLVPLEKNANLFRAPDYLGGLTVTMHSNGIHKYILSRTVLESDLFINVPKLKVHRKSGVSICLKNVVGVVGDKSCLPHYRAGGPDVGGDEFAVATAVNRMRSRLSLPVRRMGRLIWGVARPFGKSIRAMNTLLHGSNPLVGVTDGDWYGNDTLWRMVHDLNRALFYTDNNGILREQPQRRYLAVVDGVIGGEGEGPLRPSPVRSGFIIGGTDPIAVDVTCTRLMGLDWKKIPLLAEYDPHDRYPFSQYSGSEGDVAVVSSGSPRPKSSETATTMMFKPPIGWKGHIEFVHDRGVADTDGKAE
jgi:hypothetical protein